LREFAIGSGLFEELTESVKLNYEIFALRNIHTMSLRVKICGITQPEQGRAIAQLGANALGFICVHKSPRYVSADLIRQVAAQVPATVAKIGVFMDADVDWMVRVAEIGQLTGIQLHGVEAVEVCAELRDRLPTIELIKAFRVRSDWDLEMAAEYAPAVDWLLLDAYHPDMGGGTGKTLDWASLRSFKPAKPWFLAGGLNPGNVGQALGLVQPSGIDLSSGVEIAPGDKDLAAIGQLFAALKVCD
jgi:phosphoribosylanthranilate isomerase